MTIALALLASARRLTRVAHYAHVHSEAATSRNGVQRQRQPRTAETHKFSASTTSTPWQRLRYVIALTCRPGASCPPPWEALLAPKAAALAAVPVVVRVRVQRHQHACEAVSGWQVSKKQQQPPAAGTSSCCNCTHASNCDTTTRKTATKQKQAKKSGNMRCHPLSRPRCCTYNPEASLDANTKR